MGQQDNSAPKFGVVPARTPAAEVKFYRVRDFEKLQHYKNRNPPWVKLYRELILDYEFQQHHEVLRFHGIALLILASESDNKIPNDPRWVAGRIGAHEPVDLDQLFRIGLLEPWSPRPQDSYQPGEQLELAVEPAPPPDPGPAPADASKVASNLLARSASTETEQSRAETHTEADTAPAGAGRLCGCCGASVCSEFSFSDALVLAKRWKAEGRLVGGKPIENPGGLARTLHREGTADDEIRLLLRPPPRREFTGEACPTCGGSKFETVPGKGARPCPTCLDERGVRTGKCPKDYCGRGS